MEGTMPFLFALFVLGVVMFSVPEGVVLPLSIILVFGTVLAANKDAAARGVKGPLEELTQ
jgi:hypothetical protein